MYVIVSDNMCVCMCDNIHANVSDNMFFLVFCLTSVCCSALSKMVHPTDRSGKRKATSPPATPELDVGALRQHRRAEVQDNIE